MVRDSYRSSRPKQSGVMGPVSPWNHRKPLVAFSGVAEIYRYCDIELPSRQRRHTAFENYAQTKRYQYSMRRSTCRVSGGLTIAVL